jgi:hypothetical protein
MSINIWPASFVGELERHKITPDSRYFLDQLTIGAKRVSFTDPGGRATLSACNA